MELQVFYWIMGVVGGIISIFLVIIGFFLVKFINSIENMQPALNDLKISFSTFTEKFLFNSKEHEVIEKRLNDHHNRLNEHEISIVKLKEKTGCN